MKDGEECVSHGDRVFVALALVAVVLGILGSSLGGYKPVKKCLEDLVWHVVLQACCEP